MKTQREKFEEWFFKKYSRTPYTTNGAFSCKQNAAMWIAWQAAIDSVVVELPEPHEDEWHDLNFTVDEIKEAIEKAGIKHA